ncbi:MAG: nucleotidyltransferase [Armatimonadota bacterium]
MFNIELRTEISHILDDLGDTLDVPPGKYEEAREHYDAVGDWLDAPGSPLKPYRPEIYPQGSFALGTVVLPVGEEDYDVDTVCRLNTPPEAITQRQLKAMVGDRLKQHKEYAGMIEPMEGGRRCWTLRYAEGTRFHLDILPAVPDIHNTGVDAGVPVGISQHAIRITDKTTWDYEHGWPKSNPRGYAAWFMERMRIVLIQSKRARAHKITASVESIQDYEVRTPLQRAIQLLKRHRDIRCMGDEDKPISIIITTLSAQVYQNETTLLDTLVAIIPKIREALNSQKRGGVWWVANPVNPKENFADKWKESTRKADAFFDWLGALEAEFKGLLTETGFTGIGEYLTESYGAREATKAMTRYANRKQQAGLIRLGGSAHQLPASVRELSSFDVPQRCHAPWSLPPPGGATITAKWRKAGAWKPVDGSKSQVVRGSSIQFQAYSPVQQPYDVFWQVVNTGKDARVSLNLRGEIFASHDPDRPLEHHDGTSYRGRHWIECFIVQRGVCVARSGEFVVNIV